MALDTTWALHCDRGRQWWEPAPAPQPALHADMQRARAHFAAHRHVAAHSSDRVLRLLAARRQLPGNPQCGLPPPLPSHLASDPPAAALHRALAFFSTLQTQDGHWPGDYAGPLFLLPGLIIACYVSRTHLHPARAAEMRRYLRNHQNQDGGFGLHIEHRSTMFASALNYVALRLLGVPADDPAAAAARRWIHAHGGAGGVPGWGKFWLAVLGVYEWHGMHPLTPEFWLLPYALPVHPARFWCHCRVVYLPMSYLYGRRAVGQLTPLVLQLRNELYLQPYHLIPWASLRTECCPQDVYVHRPYLQRLLWGALSVFEAVWFPFKRTLRQIALDETLLLVKAEDRATNHIDIGPVNKAINLLCVWFHDPDSPDVAAHRDRIKDYLWLAEDGMKMQGYNGSQLWDTAFAAQAFVAAGPDLLHPFAPTLARAHHYLHITQVREDVPNRRRFYRHQSAGAWPFSTRDHGWPIADCTGEGLAATLLLQRHCAHVIPPAQLISLHRLTQAAEMILSYQNHDGGWATYERTRGPAWLEYLNPSEVFGDIMIDYSYVECSASAIKGLGCFRNAYPHHPLRHRIDNAIHKGIRFIESRQREDGSWYGSWGVCFLYAFWFAIDAYSSVGLSPATSASMRNACQFVLSKQKHDGSWGESYLSSEKQVYTQSEHGLVVSTAWALLALCLAKWPDKQPLQRASHFLIQSQLTDGDWPQQNICGVFNKNCMISYSQYRNIFPIWALAEYRRYCSESA